MTEVIFIVESTFECYRQRLVFLVGCSEREVADDR